MKNGTALSGVRVCRPNMSWVLPGILMVTSALSSPVLAGEVGLSTQDIQTNPQAEAPDAVNKLEDIVVTAQRRAENLQEVPIAVAAVTAQQLKDTGITTSQDIPQVVPSVQFTRSGGSGLIFVRGVGSTTAFIGEEGSNSVYVDGVYMSDLAQSINSFNNIQRIEVLKGPQGTLFGRNATGGLIHILTRDPTDEVLVNAELSYGNYETLSSRLYLSGPLSDTLSADLAFTASKQSEGWGRNLTLDRDNNVQEYFGVRSKLVYRPSETVALKLAGDYYDNEDNLGLGYKIDPETVGTGGFTGPEGHDTTVDEYPLTQQEIYGVSLTGEFGLSFADLTTITAYRHSEIASQVDVDGGPLPLVALDYVWLTKSFQQEVRLASTGEGPLSWQIGAFYLDATAENGMDSKGVALAAGGLSAQRADASLKTQSYAGFAEGVYQFTPQTGLTLGARYTKDVRELDGQLVLITLAGDRLPPRTNPITDLEYDAWTYRAALKHEFSDRINAYASYNRGFKSGSFNLASPLDAPYLPQYIDAYEIGLKSEFLDRRLRLNLAAYHYDIEDYQVRSAASAALGLSRTFNAATVAVDGLDVEFEYAPVRNLRLFGGATFLDSRFERFGGVNELVQSPIIYPNRNSSVDLLQRTRCIPSMTGTANPGVEGSGPLTGGYTTCFGDVSGNRTQNAPELTASLGGTYRWTVKETEFMAAVLYSYNSGFYFETDNVVEQEAFSLVNASLEIRPTPRLGLSLWARNIGDTEYAVQKISTGTGTTMMVGAPRTFGFTLKYDY